MFLSRFLFILFICVAAAAVFGTPSVVLAQVCSDDSDCGLGLVCRSGNCAAESTMNISVTVPAATPPGGGGGTSPPSVTFKGKAYPGALVTIYRDGAVAATALAGADALFSKDLNGLPAGTHTFGIEAEDAESRIAPTITITLSIANGSKTTISNLFLPPTIDVASSIGEGDPVKIFGHIFPGSSVSVIINAGPNRQIAFLIGILRILRIQRKCTASGIHFLNCKNIDRE